MKKLSLKSMKRNQEEVFGENKEDEEVAFINRKMISRHSSNLHHHHHNHHRSKKEPPHKINTTTNTTVTEIDDNEEGVSSIGESPRGRNTLQHNEMSSSHYSKTIFPKSLLDSYVKARQVKKQQREAIIRAQTPNHEAVQREKRYERYKKEKKAGGNYIASGDFKPTDVLPFDDLKRIVVKNQEIFKETTERVLTPQPTLTSVNSNRSLLSVKSDSFRRSRTPSPSLHSSQSVKYFRDQPSRSDSRMSLADVATVFENYLSRTSSFSTVSSSSSNSNSPTGLKKGASFSRRIVNQ
ncbi:predicted protein [Naegleria gruberi]|uniref:Predicted protein n=1 Tax=Naegleria gruberi TaxID=5762 RepID=D2VIE8_NAEGR|nr:uncharacterized protein NAEGRDRAFT_68659 [Naegleria gruberi]EFC43253.1 predicted protein [Naegleria gruberi]|eukprot:XP_002675997.1 predicted protein [Naegleria gruberi strain NEG-M]